MADAAMRAVAILGEPIFIALVAVWFLVGWLRSRPLDRQGALTALVGAGGALAVNQVVSHVWFRARPFVAHPGTVHLLIKHSTDASFPSDHTAAAFVISAILVAYYFPAGLLAIVFATLLGYARVYVGDHYPGDVLAGAVVGLLVAAVLLTWLRPVMTWLSQLVSRIMLALRLPFADRQALNVGLGKGIGR